jgi:hypothetical protein
MKKILALFCLMIVAPLQAQPIVIPGIGQFELPHGPTPSPTPEDYEKALKIFNRIASKTFQNETWKDVKFVNKTSKKEKKFSELSTIEQNILILDFAEKQTKSMLSLQMAWDDELKKFADPDFKPVPRPKIENQKQYPALKADVEIYHKELLDLRKKYAKEYEDYANKALKDLDEKERTLLINDIKKFHDTHKLIERK